MEASTSGLATTAFAPAVLVPTDVRVFLNGRGRERRGRPVRAQIGALELHRAAQAVASCPLVLLLAVPLHFTARTQSSPDRRRCR